MSSTSLDWRRWLPRPADLLLGLVFAALGMQNPATFGDPSLASLHLVLTGVCSLAVLWRQKAPAVTVGVLAAALALHVVWSPQLTLFSVIATFTVAWTVSSRFDPPWRWPLVALIYVGTVVDVVVSLVRLGQPPLGVRTWILLAWDFAAVTVAVLAGDRRRAARTRAELARERMTMLESQQSTLAQLAVAKERTRIAREVHDLLGHTLTAITAQADGARYVLRRDPDRAEEAMGTIARIAREGVGDVRALVDLLREDGESESTSPSSRTTTNRESLTPALSRGTSDLQARTPTPTSSLEEASTQEHSFQGKKPTTQPAPPEVAGAPAALGSSASDIPAPPEGFPPPAHNHLPFGEDLAHTVLTCGVPVELSIRVTPGAEPSGSDADALRAIAREALTNAIRHGHPPISVTLRCEGGSCILRVDNALPRADAGAHGAQERTRTGLGCSSMAARARQIGADFSCGAVEHGWRTEVVKQ
ncbi:hypothetical protein I6B53_02805 [Schaalia sp. 19OD2882]|uniref:sensor histidine kinase n=1 Tax=Schaalia sp. 19OD2882 TaxID=2794089 RepID=UPI001C1EAA54|nr:histidine kinase [Schaalia sp. 19OD2882]QWW20049.1 hypothetical protein I6B53_02805 [Schaalia sp. 19OD2882]